MIVNLIQQKELDLCPGLESVSLAEIGLETGTLKVEVDSRVESGYRVSTAGFESGPGWNLADTKMGQTRSDKRVGSERIQKGKSGSNHYRRRAINEESGLTLSDIKYVYVGAQG